MLSNLGNGGVKYNLLLSPLFRILQRMAQTSPDGMDRAIGQMVMTGFRGTALDAGHPFLRQLQALAPGFLVLSDVDVERGVPLYNIESPAQLRRLVSEVQAQAGEPVLFALDQEGGRVARLKGERGFPASESARSLGAKNDLSLTRRLAAASARAMREAGIYLNLAPVVDLDINPANPIIGGKERSYSASADIVVSHAAEFIRAHHENGVLCTLKHFPGQGSALKDTHLEFVDATSEWQEVELEPFRRLIEMGLADAVMTAHVYDANLDRDWPASLSGSIITGILRERLGHGGVVMTDDLQMDAISGRYGLETVILRAIQAGADVLIFGNNVVDADPEILARVVATIRQLVRQGVIPASRIEASLERIRALKTRAGVTAVEKDSTVAVPGPRTGAEELVAHRRRFKQIAGRARELFAPLDDRQVGWRPGAERWSAGECLEHLSAVASLQIPKIEEAIARGRREGLLSRGPFVYSWPGRMFVESLQASSRIRVRTMKLYTPRAGLTKEEVLGRFLRFQEEYCRLLEAAEGLDLARIKVASPANRLLRFSLGIWFAATVAHQERHLEQAARVLQNNGIPA